MELKIKRIARKDTYTIGYLLMQDRQNGQWVKLCDTIEDKDRGLKQSMTLAEIARIKVKHKTAIPTGRYRIRLDVVSPKFAQKPLYKDFCGGRIPRFEDVKGFDGICMHSGVDADSSSGCPIVGENKVVGKVVNSWATFKRVYMVLKRAANNGEEIWATVE
ncbi:MAG: DUF5675 family protein [Bacteroidales bacterium]|nr:DUF5675 family protein [Bacteroidales bacterium]